MSVPLGEEETIRIGYILNKDLVNYNDGRRKTFFCVAVNLLQIQDLKTIMERIKANTNQGYTIKEKAAYAVNLFQEIAIKQNIVLKLNKKNSSYTPF